MMHNLVLDNRESLVVAIQNGIAIAVMDGPFKAQMGTSAFILEGENSLKWLVAVNQALGQPEYQSLLQSELEGCYGVVSTVLAICKEPGIAHGSIKIACDNI